MLSHLRETTTPRKMLSHLRETTTPRNMLSHLKETTTPRAGRLLHGRLVLMLSHLRETTTPRKMLSLKMARSAKKPPFLATVF